MSDTHADEDPLNARPQSLDVKLFFGFFVVIIVMFAAGGALTIPIELAVAGAGLTMITVVSLIHRRTSGWRWRGAGWKQWLLALGSLALSGVFLVAVSTLFSPADAHMTPWFIALAAITLFNTLRALRLVRYSEATFRADCGPRTAASAATVTSAPGWKSRARLIYRVLFLLVWLDGMAFFYIFGTGIRDGAPQPTAVYSQELVNHGQVRYVTAERKQLIDTLQLGMMAGIPTMLFGGFLLQFLFGVPLFSNFPTLRRR